MIDEKIVELNGLVNNTESSLVPVLNAAIQLTELLDHSEYGLLFEHHLHGLSPELSSELLAKHPTVYSRFFSDRKKTLDTKSLIGSVSSLEINCENWQRDIDSAIEEVKRVRSVQPMPTTLSSAASVGAANGILSQYRQAHDQTREVLNRIRLRVAGYVREVENEIIRAKSFSANQTGNGNSESIGEAGHYDKKTGLFTHDVFEMDLENLYREANADGTPISLVMMDLDHFKSVNDTLGHPAGDAVLKAVAKIILDTVRSRGKAYRWGGDEFSILLPNHTANEAASLAERIRVAIANAYLPSKVSSVTASLGVAELTATTDNPTALVEDADQALLVAKVSRDLVRIFGEEPHSGQNSSERIPPRKQPADSGPFNRDESEAIRKNFFQSGFARCPFDSAKLEIQSYHIDERKTADLHVSCPMCGASDFIHGPE